LTKVKTLRAKIAGSTQHLCHLGTQILILFVTHDARQAKRKVIGFKRRADTFIQQCCPKCGVHTNRGSWNIL